MFRCVKKQFTCVSVCIHCVIHADTSTQSLCVSGLTDLFSVLPFVPHPAVPSQSLPHLPYGTCQIKLVVVVWDLPASSAGLWFVLEEPKVGSCDCAGATISCAIKSWIFLPVWCGVGVSELIWGEIRCRISLSDSSSFLLNVLSIFTDLEGFLQVVLLLPCSSSLFLAPLPFLIFSCS